MIAPHPDAGVQERLGVIERVANAGRSWKRATFTCLGLLGLSLALHGYAFTRTSEKFYAIELDSCRGDSRVVGPIPDTLTFHQVQIHRVIQDFVMDMRGSPLEVEVTRAQWRRLREQVSPEGARLLMQEEAKMQPQTRKEAVVVQVVRIQQREGTRYDVRWTEKRYGANRELITVENWGGLFTFAWGTPKKSAPLGMYFTLASRQGAVTMQTTPPPRLRPWVLPVAIAFAVLCAASLALLPWMLRQLSWPTVTGDVVETAPGAPMVLPDSYREPTTTYGVKPVKEPVEEKPTVVQAGLTLPSGNGVHPPPAALIPKTQAAQPSVPTAVLQPTPALPLAAQAPASRAMPQNAAPVSLPGQEKPPRRWGIELTHAREHQTREPTRKEQEEGVRTEAAKGLIKQAVWAVPAYPKKTLYRQQAIPGITIDEMVSDIPGQYKIRVSVPVWDRFEREVELIPKDSIIIVVQKRVPGYGEERLELGVEEIQPPTPEVISLKASVSDKEGAAGISGEVNRHIPQLILATLISTAISVGGRISAGNAQGYQYSVGQEVARDAGQQVSQDAKSIVDKTLRLPPTIKIKANTPVTISLMENVTFSRNPIVVR
jgi:type IV secretory pathway VirB10-like protein/type IV secretory pathway TrbF-like protein